MHERMPEGHLRLRGSTWWCQWKRLSRPYGVSLKTKVEREAKVRFDRQMDLVRASILDGSFHDRFDYGAAPAKSGRGRDIPLSEAWARYLRSVTKPDTGDSTLAQYALQFGRLVDWTRQHHGAATTVRSFTRNMAREFSSDLAPTVAASTFNKYVNLLRMAFRILLEELGVRENPWDGIQRKRLNGNGRRSFTQQELTAIFAVIDRRIGGEEAVSQEDGTELVKRLSADEIADAREMRTLCLLGYHTGLRFCDCCLLQWDEVDFGKGVITRAPLKTRRRHPERRVIIPLTDELRQHLEAIHAENRGEANEANGSPFVCPRFSEQYDHNGHAGRSEATDKLMRLFVLAGVRVHKDGTGKGTGKRAVVEAGFHSFRHTWVTTSAEAGVDPATIRAIVGWGSPAMERVYTHVSEEHLRSAMAKRPSLAGAISTPNGVATIASNGVSTVAPAPSDPAPSLEGMGKAELERLLAAVSRKLGVTQKPVGP